MRRKYRSRERPSRRRDRCRGVLVQPARHHPLLRPPPDHNFLPILRVRPPLLGSGVLPLRAEELPPALQHWRPGQHHLAGHGELRAVLLRHPLLPSDLRALQPAHTVNDAALSQVLRLFLLVCTFVLYGPVLRRTKICRAVGVDSGTVNVQIRVVLRGPLLPVFLSSTLKAHHPGEQNLG